MKLATLPVTRDTLLEDIAQAINVLLEYGSYGDRSTRAARVAMELLHSVYMEDVTPREPTYSGDWSTAEIDAIHVYFNSDTDQFEYGKWESCFRYLLWDAYVSYAYLGAEKRNRRYIDIAFRLRQAYDDLKRRDYEERISRLSRALWDATGKFEWELSDPDLVTA